MDPWGSFELPSSSSPDPASSAWSLGDVIPDWSDATLSPVPRSWGTGSGAQSVQRSTTASQPTDVEEKDDPWATAVSPPADAFTQVVLPEPKISPQVECADVSLASSESKPDQVPVKDGAEIVHSSTVADSSKDVRHVDKISCEPEGLSEQVLREVKASLQDEDEIGKATVRPGDFIEHQSSTDNQGNKMAEEDNKEQRRESVALQQESDKTETAEMSSNEPNDDSELRSSREANDKNSTVDGDVAEKANGKTNASGPILLEPAGKNQDETPEDIGTTSPKPQEWETSQPFLLSAAAEIGVPVSPFAESAGFDGNSDDLTFSNPFAPELEKAPLSANELLPEIFPLPTVIDNERDSIANYFSDSQVAPPPLLNFGKARKLNAMFTRPTRQFFTPTPRISTPSQPSSPASSVNTSTSHPDDGIRVKWKHTEIQSRVQNVVEVWKNKRKDIGGMFDWDNADALGPTSPTNAFVMDSMATGSATDRGPPSPRLKRMFSSGATPAGVEAPISFNWQDDVVGGGGGTGVWGSSSSSRSPVEAQPPPVLSQTASIPTLQPVAVQHTMMSQPATITKEDDNVDDWGDFTVVQSAPKPAQPPKLQLDTKRTSFSDEAADKIWGSPANPVANGSVLEPLAQPSTNISPQPGSEKQSANDGPSIERPIRPLEPLKPLQPTQSTFTSNQLLQPTSVALATPNMISVQDEDDWGDLMGTPTEPAVQELPPGINNDLLAPQPDPETELQPSQTSTSSSSHHSHHVVHAHLHPHVVHHHKPKHMSAVYIPPPKPSSPASSMYLSSSSSSSSDSSASDVRSTIHVEGTFSKHGTTMLSPTAPKITDAKMRDDQTVRRIVESLPDIEYLLD